MTLAVKLGDIKQGEMFRHVDFESESNKVYTHLLSWSEGDPYSILYEGPIRCYEFAHVGNIVNGKLEMVPKSDIKYSRVSLLAAELYSCVPVSSN